MGASEYWKGKTSEGEQWRTWGRGGFLKERPRVVNCSRRRRGRRRKGLVNTVEVGLKEYLYKVTKTNPDTRKELIPP